MQNPENVSVKIDWVSMLKRMVEEYLQNTQTYSQYLDCGKLASALEEWQKRQPCYLLQVAGLFLYKNEDIVQEMNDFLQHLRRKNDKLISRKK